METVTKPELNQHTASVLDRATEGAHIVSQYGSTRESWMPQTAAAVERNAASWAERCLMGMED